MPSLTDKEKELVAIGASIGTGCQPCAQYHVGAGLKAGLTRDEVSWAIDGAQAVRREGGIAVSNVGRRILGVEREQAGTLSKPGERGQALVYIGAAAGCNAGSLLQGYIATAVERLGLGVDEVRSAVELAEVVKQRAADFLRRDIGRALGQREEAAAVTALASEEAGGTGACCEPPSEEGGNTGACCGPAS
jgi:AhpD family alkylhydroperoxidase